MRSLKMLSIALYRFDSKINLWGIKWLEAYPTVVVSRYLDCKIWELTKDLSLALDVIPQDKTIEIVAAGEEHPPLGLLGHAVRKTDVFLGL